MEPKQLKVCININGRPMRVLSVIPGESEGTSFIFAKRQVAELQKRGIANRTFFLASRTSIRLVFREWRRLRKEISEFQPDLVNAHYGTLTAFLCSYGTRFPLVVTYRGSDLWLHPELSFLRSRVGMLLSQTAALRASHIICVSKGLSQSLWWKRDKVTIISSGIDTSIFYPRPQNKVRSELGWPKEERVVIFNCGKEPLRKRFALAESAVRVARSLYGDIKFLVMEGDVPPDRVPLFLNAADCLLVTSDYEGSPNIVKEALACNLPIVSVDVGDVRERLQDVNLAYIIERDPIALGKAIVQILKNGRRCNGYQKSLELSLDKTTDMIINIYQSVIRRFQ